METPNWEVVTVKIIEVTEAEAYGLDCAEPPSEVVDPEAAVTLPCASEGRRRRHRRIEYSPHRMELRSRTQTTGALFPVTASDTTTHNQTTGPLVPMSVPAVAKRRSGGRANPELTTVKRAIENLRRRYGNGPIVVEDKKAKCQHCRKVFSKGFIWFHMKNRHSHLLTNRRAQPSVQRRNK